MIGVSSNGFHSNGYSLLRKVFAQDFDQWIDYLLRPTHLYVSLMKELQEQKVELHAAAHITGEGIENVPRVLPSHLSWEGKAWDWPEPFYEVQRRTGMTDGEMLRTLNCGVGFTLIVPPSQGAVVQEIARGLGYGVFDLGSIVPRPSAEHEIIGL